LESSTILYSSTRAECCVMLRSSAANLRFLALGRRGGSGSVPLPVSGMALGALVASDSRSLNEFTTLSRSVDHVAEEIWKWDFPPPVCGEILRWYKEL